MKKVNSDRPIFKLEKKARTKSVRYWGYSVMWYQATRFL